jgi:hypothetical protein
LEAIAYFRARNRNNAYHTVIREFQDSGLSQATVARRLGKRPEIISRLLGAPGNWTLDTISDLLFAISGAESTYGLSYPLEKPVRNDTQPEWVDQPSTETKREASSAMEANERNVKFRLVDQGTARRLGKVPQSTTHQQELIRALPQNTLGVQGASA